MHIKSYWIINYYTTKSDDADRGMYRTQQFNIAKPGVSIDAAIEHVRHMAPEGKENHVTGVSSGSSDIQVINLDPEGTTVEAIGKAAAERPFLSLRHVPEGMECNLTIDALPSLESWGIALTDVIRHIANATRKADPEFVGAADHWTTAFAVRDVLVDELALQSEDPTRGNMRGGLAS